MNNKMNEQERQLRASIIRQRMNTDAALAAAIELVEAELADDDINNDEAHERVHKAVSKLVAELGYGVGT